MIAHLTTQRQLPFSGESFRKVIPKRSCALIVSCSHAGSFRVALTDHLLQLAYLLGDRNARSEAAISTEI
jgi:hypothetical protein